MNDHTTHDSTQEIPYGYCHCGCGQKTKIAKINSVARGWVKGEPLRYLNRHYGRLPEPSRPLNPTGLCMCGCGQPAPIALRSNARLGHIKGQPVRYRVGHSHKGKERGATTARFWAKVDKRGANDCWPWLAGTDNHGYGKFWDGEHMGRAHRFSYRLANGPFPNDLDCLHKCDNPRCVNPAHLFLGTAKDNHDDMVAKGRNSPPPPNQVEGEANGLARYTNAQVREFRRLFAESDISITAFAKLHGVSFPTMWRILNRTTYRNA